MQQSCLSTVRHHNSRLQAAACFLLNTLEHCIHQMSRHPEATYSVQTRSNTVRHHRSRSPGSGLFCVNVLLLAETRNRCKHWADMTHAGNPHRTYIITTKSTLLLTFMSSVTKNMDPGSRQAP